MESDVGAIQVSIQYNCAPGYSTWANVFSFYYFLLFITLFYQLDSNIWISLCYFSVVICEKCWGSHMSFWGPTRMVVLRFSKTHWKNITLVFSRLIPDENFIDKVQNWYEKHICEFCGAFKFFPFEFLLPFCIPRKWKMALEFWIQKMRKAQTQNPVAFCIKIAFCDGFFILSR